MMMMDTQVLFASEPKGDLLDSNFKVEKVDMPILKEDGIVVETLYLSVDPYMRIKMENDKSNTSKYELGKPLYGDGIGRVMQAKNCTFKEGDLVMCSHMWWKEVAVYTTRDIQQFCMHTLDTMGMPPKECLYTLGMTGMTAWIGMQVIGQPKPGCTVLVSCAAGAVGCLAGQIARIRGCQVIGLAGSQEKCQMLTKEFGFHKAICYKDADFEKTLEKEFPKGIDVFWDSCGGKVLDCVLPNMADFGKIVGFIVHDHIDKYAQATQEMAEWYKQGKIKTKITVCDGMDHMVDALKGLFCGKNVGKMLVRICDENKGPKE